MTTFLVALNMREASYYCSLLADPPLDVHDERSVKVFSTDAPVTAMKGRHFTEEDSVIFYGRYYEGRYAFELEEILRSVAGSSGMDFRKIARWV